jgi:hypothetical protein
LFIDNYPLATLIGELGVGVEGKQTEA